MASRTSLVLLWLLFAVCCGVNGQQIPPNATALNPVALKALCDQQADTFFGLLAEANKNASSASNVFDFLAEGFQVQRADGSGSRKATYTIPQVGKYNISDMKATAPISNVIICRYNSTVNESTSTGPQNNVKAPRLSGFTWFDGDASQNAGWKIVSHANFHPPATAACTWAQDIPVGVENSTDAATLALANTLLNNLFAHLIANNGSAVMSPAIQIQRADGSGVTGLGEYQNVTWKSFKINHLTATRQGNVLVARFDEQGEQGGVGGPLYSTAVKPKMTTFVLSEPPVDNWLAAANAQFNMPKPAVVPPTCGQPSSGGKIGWNLGLEIAAAVMVGAILAGFPIAF
jgi:hypothetical protein